ncbi:hypothetical protein V3C10_21125 [[Clostridium] symbiosum]|uniref:hypothetical protein n=1 Tax=Clostridium symbiosum TaxID=1512 RepID=UPI001D0913F2|nr:hypothetical protein [[Clostridium] symbiosum]MCB6930980.1 hypothetical protein [[Clostridium] symbiosum]
MSLQSRFAECDEGESRRKNSYGDSLPLLNAQRMLDSVIPHQAPADSKVPFGKFSPSFPGKVFDGTEDAKVFAIPNPGLRPLICSYSFKGGGIVAATMFP